MFMPYDKDAPIVVVQPPTELAHLSGDELFEALTDPEKFQAATGHPPAEWDSARFRAEVGRSEGRFKVWMVKHYDVTVRKVDPGTIEDRIMVAPDRYEKRSPRWLETTARKWAIEEKIMRRDGILVPYKPTGKTVGAVDRKKRTRKAPMRAGALEVLAACEELTAAGKHLAAAKAELAERYNMTGRKIARRLTTGREMRAAGIRPLTEPMPAAEAAEIIWTMYRLLMADGRRKHTDNARAEVADRLGCPRAEVDRVLDQT